MNKLMHAPTSVRWLTIDEWNIVDRVFGNTLPWRRRILITNGAGLNGRPFTIPTALITALPVAISTAFATLITKNPVFFAGGALLGELNSITNMAYLINVGPDFYPDLTAVDLDNQYSDASATLVHEMTHVWQGKNSAMALSYVFNSVINQAFQGQHAYDYSLPADWKSLNAEQQGKFVEDWYWRENSDTSTASPRFKAIDDFVRRGRA